MPRLGVRSMPSNAETADGPRKAFDGELLAGAGPPSVLRGAESCARSHPFTLHIAACLWEMHSWCSAHAMFDVYEHEHDVVGNVPWRVRCTCDMSVCGVGARPIRTCVSVGVLPLRGERERAEAPGVERARWRVWWRVPRRGGDRSDINRRAERRQTRTG